MFGPPDSPPDDQYPECPECGAEVCGDGYCMNPDCDWEAEELEDPEYDPMDNDL